jgi:tetratricopeptide (TPR) repeat protein
MQSSLVAMGLALFFLTLFSYYILRVYFRTQRPEQMHYLVSRYISACQVLLNYQKGVPEHHLALANACLKLAKMLEGKEDELYHLPRWLAFLSKNVEHISAWWHWEDVHAIREILLQKSIEEHIELVKCEPTGMEAHTALANTYVMLSSLYVTNEKQEDAEEADFWTPPKFRSPLMEKKFRQTAERAIEEFKIIGDYAPNDPWVHSQLAYSYRDLKMPEQEIKEYEILLKLMPEEKDTMYKLGVLYFQQGREADGLQIYEKLKRSHLKKAEALIKHYGANLKRIA